jgi:hypothetical protein
MATSPKTAEGFLFTRVHSVAGGRSVTRARPDARAAARVADEGLEVVLIGLLFTLLRVVSKCPRY